jgi:hypothetical protein
MQRLKTLLTSPRVYKDLTVAAFCAVICLFLVMLIGVPRTSELALQDNGVLTLSVENGVLLSGFQCTSVYWDARNVLPGVSEHHQELPSQGSAEVCFQEELVINIHTTDEISYTFYPIPPILWINPFHLISCILSFFVFILILSRPHWFADYWSEAVFIGFVTTAVGIFFLFNSEGNLQQTVVSLGFSLVSIVLIYIYRHNSKRAFVIVCLLFMAIIFADRVSQMLLSPELLNYDERFYLSIAATANGGHGLYPSLQNYPSIPVMGGIGHFAWLYVLAYKILGPSLFSLRVVALLVGLLGLPAIFLLFRRWYGPVTGWLAVTIIPATYFYVMAFSVRMDIFTVTCIWWALLLIDIAREKRRWYWHLCAGLWIGLCLQAHIHTSIMAIAFGILYIVDYGRIVRQAGRWLLPSNVLLYSFGALIGLGLFIVFNIMPDPDAFFRTAGNAARFDEMGVSPDAPLLDRLLGSLTAVGIFWTKFTLRITSILTTLYPVEWILWVAACLSLFYRGLNRVGVTTVILSISTVMVGFFILNNESLLYTIHISPALLLYLPPFFTYGFRRPSFEWSDIKPYFLLILSVYILPMYMVGFQSPKYPPLPDLEPASTLAISFVRDHISVDCSLVGPHNIFVYGLPMYSIYYSSQHISFGLSYYSYKSELDLWRTLSPDLALTIGTSPDLIAWLSEANYEEIFPNVWKKTHEPLSPGCDISL